ncbi:hypothetical protein BW14_08645 [Bifidobacterium sp. UTBIF-68]|uniref:hypothetical protein n=1 Tax=Bifidobacterium sp. UTBIF-68 TaxID=1465262 RepID=UPI0011289894|nr:hypothetical protein [Bifidobacterium sp. UTBIF-68]TPF92481.1 hypothetical protein BW14_08645 [Bifidobacterium sp. UTBIF-68]
MTVDLLHYELAGRLDPLDVTIDKKDVDNLRRIIHMCKALAGQNTEGIYERDGIDVSRTALTTYWETPRTEFHKDMMAEFSKGKKPDMGSKLLLIPWSPAAFASFKRNNNSVKGLLLEHATPIKAMWDQLVKLDEEAEDDGDWHSESVRYLTNAYRLVVLTSDEAKAIDKYGERDKNDWPSDCKTSPFRRYEVAKKKAAAAKAKGVKDPLIETLLALDLHSFEVPARRGDQTGPAGV